jgi:hypothetical protein
MKGSVSDLKSLIDPCVIKGTNPHFIIYSLLRCTLTPQHVWFGVTETPRQEGGRPYLGVCSSGRVTVPMSFEPKGEESQVKNVSLR